MHILESFRLCFCLTFVVASLRGTKELTENDIEPNISNESKASFLNKPSEDRFMKLKKANEDDSEFTEQEDIFKDFFDNESLADFRDIVSSIKEISVHDGVYYPYQIHQRKKRSSMDDILNTLGNVVTFLEQMVNSTEAKEKKGYLNQATSNLDRYIDLIKSTMKDSKGSSLQIMKTHNVLIVQCAGWLWYPIVRLNKTITCADSIMRFEGRDRTVARACNLYNCMDLAL